MALSSTNHDAEDEEFSHLLPEGINLAKLDSVADELLQSIRSDDGGSSSVSARKYFDSDFDTSMGTTTAIGAAAQEGRGLNEDGDDDEPSTIADEEEMEAITRSLKEDLDVSEIPTLVSTTNHNDSNYGSSVPSYTGTSINNSSSSSKTNKFPVTKSMKWGFTATATAKNEEMSGDDSGAKETNNNSVVLAVGERKKSPAHVRTDDNDNNQGTASEAGMTLLSSTTTTSSSNNHDIQGVEKIRNNKDSLDHTNEFIDRVIRFLQDLVGGPVVSREEQLAVYVVILAMLMLAISLVLGERAQRQMDLLF
mmetsp:Transcript_29197/g.41323  ORF Transcript_29197/g.41323 Transcript_29197/m.41323 type:complete len:308 (-) Transcript_29197:800-1723(-)|eukprot:CAMPEP_0202454202 /NCGR_PEP_ID=MMETSP1360-20130828/12003_1 /ASSEMBLY_ACC=CAM_ASM_000848 /TAXON_ID=515479 /ORGANISM="Licmophora paradoxa, Strain CCMP2313" /LENGTH=307 /DNA_ID=CAMNT_0049073469 /DNA_START=111 /DNA_END=1034 /DNA_ORIENTATION=-